ncbi:bifunctional serine/threonine protein kinase/MFS transporter [Streptomyces sp. NPDC053493]|uniref:bifunctional serine/threonine protein kinase/MFS transporter n=1 Tax=Streptomyces sp. NPDC053493 TaxID=3365705 RepID=UPI0037D471DA
MDQLTAQDPARIGPYRLIARLGAGGMGLVYLGRSEGGRTVAVKVVQAEYAGNAEFRRRFAREVAAARRVGGDWTAAVLDADPEAEVPWVATRYIPGPDLHTVVAEDFGPLPEHSVHALANRLALALRAVHEAGLIHRDLKPSNVLVTVDGPRVIDFGIARAMDSLTGDSLHTRTGMLIGSPGFMSPEQVRGLELTPASDVFCLGAVLVYAATGRMLFGATDTGLNAHLFRIAEEEADLTGVPESLLDLVRGCLEKDPARRPTPREVAERTATDLPGEWLPGSVLAQLGRHAAQLLDFAPPPVPSPASPASPPSQEAAPVAVPAQPDPRDALARHGHAAGPEAAAGTKAGDAPPRPAHTPAGFGPPVPPGQPPVPAAWTPTTPAHLHDAAHPPARRWWGLTVAALVSLLVPIDAAVFGRAATAVHIDLGLGLDTLNLVFQVYAVALGGLMPLGGHLTDLIGRRRTLVAGLLLFLLASVLVGTAPGGGLLVVARALLGAAGALLTPAALALVASGFPDAPQRRRAFGVYAAVTGAAGGLGALVGGTLVEMLTWRLALYAGIPFAVLALILTLARVREPAGGAGTRFDPAGVLLGCAAVASLLYGLTRISSTEGGTDPLTVVPCVAGVLLLPVFLWRQGKRSGALLAPHVLKDPRRAGSAVALALLGAGTFTAHATLTYSLPAVFGYPPMTAGLMLLPAVVTTVIGATAVAAPLAGRVEPRILIATGATLLAGAFALLTRLDAHAGYAADLLPALLLIGLGAGLAFMPLYSAATEGVEPRLTGGTAGVVALAVQLGAGIGAAVVGGILGARLYGGGGRGGAGGVRGVVLAAHLSGLWWATGGALLAALVAVLAVRTRRVTPAG